MPRQDRSVCLFYYTSDVYDMNGMLLGLDACTEVMETMDRTNATLRLS